MSNRTMSTTMVTSSSSSSAETIEGNEYLLTEILVHLPAKSLLRLKCVSKRWDSLISSPYFRGRHTLLHGGAAATAKGSGMILHPDLCSNPEKFKLFSFKNGRSRHSPSPFNSIAKNHNPNGIYIRQSCNGLILGTITFHRYKSSPESHFIMNPTTKDFTLIPHPGPSIYQVVRLGLAFDPLLSSSYTVICVWRSSTSNYTSNYRFMVYSSETRAWKACESSSVVPTDTRIGKGVYFNGAVHWFCWRQRVSLCFDVREECINDNMPPLPTRQHHYHAAPSCGHLNLVGIGGSVMNVFRLERDYSKWVPIHTVDIQLTQLPTAFPDIFYHSSSIGQTDMAPQYDVLCLMQDDREDSEDGDMSLLLELPSKIIALRFKDNTFYQVFDLAGVGRRAICPGHGRYTASAYVASLACV